MKETFEDYLQRLKDRRTEDDYKYTDEDFSKYEEYIRDCCKNGMSVYKCLEFMYFAKQDMDDQLFNREPKQETLEEAGLKHCDILDKFPALINPLFSFKEGAKWQQENTNINALNFEIDALKKEIKVLKHQQEQDKNKYSEEEVLKILYEWSMYKVHIELNELSDILNYDKWFEQNKNK